MILFLQISGFVAAVVLLIVPGAPQAGFVVAFAIHLAGDLLFIRKEGLPGMSFNIEDYIKVAPWLQFVGLMVTVGGLLSLQHWFGVPVAYLGVGVSLAGFVYNEIYK